MEISYWVAKEAFGNDGREIINATPKSKLSEDVFAKVDFNSIAGPTVHVAKT